MKRYLMLSIWLAFIATSFVQNTEEGIYNPSTSTKEQYYSQTEPEIDFNGESSFNDLYLPAPQVRSLDNILWKKTVWRMIDMREQINFPLYYPLKEVNGRINLFLTMFNLLKEGKVNAYEYDEKKEDFSDGNKLSFSEVMEKTGIDGMFELKIDNNGDSIYTINEVDIPNEQILKFYLKEVWYYDAMESCMKFKIEAIAPQRYYEDESLGGQIQKSILFWVPFDQLRPYLAKQPVVINNMNSTAFISYDDLFQKRRFNGYIYKEDNIQNRMLIEYCNTPDEIRSEQKRIEDEILNFEFDLWEY